MDTKVFQYKVFLSLILVAFETTICESSVSKCKGEGNLNIFFKRILNEKHSSIVGSKPLSHLCGRNTNVASASRAIWAQPKSTSTLELVPALAVLNKSTHYEYEIRSAYCKCSSCPPGPRAPWSHGLLLWQHRTEEHCQPYYLPSIARSSSSSQC